MIARIPEFHQRMTEPKSVALPTWRHPNVKDEKYTSKADSSLQGEKRDSPKYASFRASSPLTETPANGQQKTSISSFLLQSMHIPLFSDTKVCSYGTEYHNQAKKSSFVEGFQKNPVRASNSSFGRCLVPSISGNIAFSRGTKGAALLSSVFPRQCLEAVSQGSCRFVSDPYRRFRVATLPIPYYPRCSGHGPEAA